MLGCFNPIFGSNMDKPKRWVKMLFKNVIQLLSLSIFAIKLGWNNPVVFRVWGRIIREKLWTVNSATGRRHRNEHRDNRNIKTLQNKSLFKTGTTLELWQTAAAELSFSATQDSPTNQAIVVCKYPNGQ